SEAGYMELGKSVRVLLAPGELAPEIAMGGFLTKETSSLRKNMDKNHAYKTITADGFKGKCLVFGLMNDEIGYIVPTNDFYTSYLLPSILNFPDRFGNGHYEETVSAGPKTCGILLDSWKDIFKATR
ncbi:MAG: hypothetical protein FWF08_05610, partial [Oscillospiraceae bacterium]|nr:hypothetical protein [Oscillospiraceae bacterium]